MTLRLIFQNPVTIVYLLLLGMRQLYQHNFEHIIDMSKNQELCWHFKEIIKLYNKTNP